MRDRYNDDRLICDVCHNVISQDPDNPSPGKHFTKHSFDHGVLFDLIKDAGFPMHDFCHRCYHALREEKEFYDNVQRRAFINLMDSLRRTKSKRKKP